MMGRPIAVRRATAFAAAWIWMCAGAVPGSAEEVEAAAADGAEAAAAGADAGARVRELMQAWINESPLARGLDARDDVLMVQGVGEAGLSADSSRWGKSRALAYEGAYLDALREFVERRRSTISVEVARSYFQEDIPEEELVYRPAELPDEYLGRVAGKAAVLTERNLDQALIESGMTEEEVQSLAADQKHVTFADTYARETLVRAFGEASGVVPVKTFEAVDAQGFTVVGVVAAFSQRMHTLADRVARGRVIRPDPDRADAPLHEQLAAFADADLPREFGVRVLEDEQGYPVLVSFGQWGLRVAEGDSNRARSRRREFALRQAESAAQAYLAQFVQTSAGFSSRSTVVEGVEEMTAVGPDGLGWESEVATITDRLTEKAQAESQVSLTGLKTARTWEAGHPEVAGHRLVGVIVAWSPAQEDAVRTSVGERPKHAVEPAAAPTASTAAESQSREVMDESDF